MLVWKIFFCNLFSFILLILKASDADLVTGVEVFKNFLVQQNLKNIVILNDAEISQLKNEFFSLVADYRLCFYSYKNYFKNNTKNHISCLLRSQHTHIGIFGIYQSDNRILKEFIKAYVKENLRYQKMQSWLLYTIENNFTKQQLQSEFGDLELNTYSDITLVTQENR